MDKLNSDYIDRARRKTNIMLEELYELMSIVKVFNREAFENMPFESYLDDLRISEYNILMSYLNDSLKSCIPEKCSCDKECCKLDGCTKKKELGYTETDGTNKIREFLDRVNSTLDEKHKIDKEEAIKAKKVYDKDIANDYDNVAKEVNIELFDTDEPISEMELGELKYLIYKNHWDKEFDNSLINSRIDVLSFLYHKLEEGISDKLIERNGKKIKEKKRLDDDIYDSMLFLLKNCLN